MEKQEDGSLIVYGTATNETLDSDQQIVDLTFSKQAVPEWLATGGNVRVMHSTNLYPAGVGMMADTTGNNVDIKAQIFEPTAVLLCEKKVLKAFSVGIANPKVVHDMKARGGRIVGGEIIEISLVDRPANPDCQYNVIKSSKGEPELVSTFSKGESVSDQEVPEVSKTLDLTDEKDVEVKSVDPEAATALPSEKSDDETVSENTDEATKSDAPPAKEDKPAEDETDEGPPAANETPASEDEPAADAEDGAKKTEDEPEVTKTVDESDDLDAGSDVSKSDSSDTSSISWAIKRFHAAVCAAYSSDAVKAEFPTLEKDDSVESMGEPTKAALYSMLSKALTEDSGDGHGAVSIKGLAASYAEVSELLKSEAWKLAEGDAAELLFAAHDDLHGAFKLANVDDPSAPNLTPGTVDPGKYNRPLITAGHAQAVASAQDNTSEVNQGDKGEPDPGAITRGPLTEGHERLAKAAGENLDPAAATQSPPTAGRMFYSNDQKAQAQAALQAMHDHITAIFPILCPMGGTTPVDDIPREDVMPDDVMDDSGSDPAELIAGKTVEAPTVEGSTVPATKSSEKVASVVTDEQPIGYSEEQAAAITKAITADIQKIYESRLHDLETLVEKMASEPDPALEPFRGTAGVVGKVAEKVAHKTPDEIQKDNAAVEIDPDALDYIRHVALRGSDPVAQRAAIEKLVALTGAKTG